jgi:hypothetical protein
MVWNAWPALRADPEPGTGQLPSHPMHPENAEIADDSAEVAP